MHLSPTPGKLVRQGGIANLEVLGCHRVAVMQAAESRRRDDLVSVWRHRRCNSTSGSVLPQSKMSPVFVVIANVLSQQSSQMSVIQNDHMDEQLPTDTPNPALGNAILPGTSKGGADRFRAVLFDGRYD